MNFIYNNLEFDIVKRSDVTITCLDKLLHKSYQETFTESDVNEHFNLQNLDNFVEILKSAFKKNTVDIITQSDQISINVNFNDRGFTFKFDVVLLLNDSTQLTANSLYIKKLEERIKELENTQLVYIGQRYHPRDNIYSPILLPKKVELVVSGLNTNLTDLIYNDTGCGNNYYYSSISYDNASNTLTLGFSISNANTTLYDAFKSLKFIDVTFKSCTTNDETKNIFLRQKI